MTDKKLQKAVKVAERAIERGTVTEDDLRELAEFYQVDLRHLKREINWRD